MAARHEIWLRNDEGTRIADGEGHIMLDRIYSLTATRIANDIGTFTAEVPVTFDQTLLRRDMIIELLRAPPGASLLLFRFYFLRRWNFKTRRGKTSLELHGVGTNDLLRRRVIRGSPTSPVTEFNHNEYTDDAMKRMITEAQVDSGGGSYWPATSYGTRAYPNFTVEGDASAGPLLGERLDLSNEYILRPNGIGALHQIAEIAADEGDEVFFDVAPLVVTGKEVTFIFRTRIGQPGQDLTGHGVLFSQDQGNLKDPSLTYDYTEEENYIWSVKEKGKYNTIINQEYDQVAHDASIWNRCEGTTDRNAMAGKPYLREHRGRVNFTGSIIDVTGTRFGVHWNFGDKVSVRYQRFKFDTIIRAVTLQLDRKGKETISARFEYQADA